MKVTIIIGLVVVLVGLAIWFATWVITQEEKAQKEYRNSLFNQLGGIRNKLYPRDYEKTPILMEFNEISKKILKLEDNFATRRDNMRLLDSLSYHEINALKKVWNALNLGIPITEENIQNALGEINRELKKHYKEFCELQTADIQQETFILKTIRQKELERVELEGK